MVLSRFRLKDFVVSMNISIRSPCCKYPPRHWLYKGVKQWTMTTKATTASNSSSQTCPTSRPPVRRFAAAMRATRHSVLPEQTVSFYRFHDQAPLKRLPRSLGPGEDLRQAVAHSRLLKNRRRRCTYVGITIASKQ